MGAAIKAHKRDLIIYIAIGVSLPTAMVAWVYLIPERFWPHLTYTWYSFILFTVLMGVVLAKLYWHRRNSLKLWLVLALLMAIHTVAYVIVLSHVHQWSAIWYVITMPFECMLFGVIIKLWLNVLPRKVGIW